VRLPAAEPTEGQVLLGLNAEESEPDGEFRVMFSRVGIHSY
jgi:hypothetical protein